MYVSCNAIEVEVVMVGSKSAAPCLRLTTCFDLVAIT